MTRSVRQLFGWMVVWSVTISKMAGSYTSMLLSEHVFHIHMCTVVGTSWLIKQTDVFKDKSYTSRLKIACSMLGNKQSLPPLRYGFKDNMKLTDGSY